MKKLYFESKFLFNKKDKPLWVGFIFTMAITLISVYFIFFGIGLSYKKSFVEPYAKQILDFPEFQISKDGLIINGDNYQKEVNGVMIIVNDDVKLSELVYEYSDNDYKKVVIIAKDGIANYWNSKLVLYDEYAESDIIEDLTISDSHIKLMVLNSELVLNEYFDKMPYMTIVISVILVLAIYSMYGLIIFVIVKVLKYKLSLKNIFNIITYSYIIPLISFGSVMVWGNESKILVLIVESLVVIYYLQVLLYFNVNGGKDDE